MTAHIALILLVLVIRMMIQTRRKSDTFTEVGSEKKPAADDSDR
jgi:hypothetical protein